MSKKTQMESAALGLKIVSLVIMLWLAWGAKSMGYFDRWLMTPQARFAKVWRDDFDKLKLGHHLPVDFEKIRIVEYTPTTDLLKDLIKKETLPPFVAREQNLKSQKLKQKPKSGEDFVLQVFMDQTEEGGVIVQYDLVNEHGNTVWELGRTFNQKLFIQ